MNGYLTCAWVCLALRCSVPAPVALFHQDRSSTWLRVCVRQRSAMDHCIAAWCASAEGHSKKGPASARKVSHGFTVRLANNSGKENKVTSAPAIFELRCQQDGYIDKKKTQMPSPISRSPPNLSHLHPLHPLLIPSPRDGHRRLQGHSVGAAPQCDQQKRRPTPLKS